MKSRRSKPRKAGDLCESIQHQLNMYAIAAGATGVGALALAQPTEAKIVYTPANVQISGNQHYDLDLNNDGVTDFTLSHFSTHRSYHNGGFDAQRLDEEPSTGNGAIGSPPAALRGGERISHGKLFYASSGTMAFSEHRCRLFHCTHHSAGNWLNVTNRYLGLAFQIHGKTHYAWARLNVSSTTATLTGYAYETIPGKAVIAGQTKGPADQSGEEKFVPSASLTNPIPTNPQPASLGMLALGFQAAPL